MGNKNVKTSNPVTHITPVTLPVGTTVQHVRGSARFSVLNSSNNDEKKEKVYYTHDNGGQPYKVVYNDDVISVYLRNGCDNNGKTLYHDDAEYKFESKQVFIGKSPRNQMTEFSGGYGKEFDGNSILLNIENLKYVYIGKCIFSFNTISPIVTYNSPVGNNDVPYPYAVDTEGRHYLMIENVILDKVPSGQDPYRFFYDNNTVIKEANWGYSNKPAVVFDGISTVYEGYRKTCLYYNPSDNDLGYDWIRHGKILYGKKGISDKFVITKDMYIDMMTRFAEAKGFRRLVTDMICDREY